MINIYPINSTPANEIEVLCLLLSDGYDYNQEFYFYELKSVKEFILKDVSGLTQKQKKKIKECDESIEAFNNVFAEINEFEVDKLYLRKTSIKIY